MTMNYDVGVFVSKCVMGDTTSCQFFLSKLYVINVVIVAYCLTVDNIAFQTFIKILYH